MGKAGGFLEINREEASKRPIQKRVEDYKELYKPFTESYLKSQAARCMDCGVPFCQFACPLGNLCPEWNDFVHKGNWKKALEILEETNNFPEFTGRVCPVLCEGSCVLGLNDKPVTIRNIELSIVEKGWEEGWIKPKLPKIRTKKKVAVVGSGPAGLAAAQQLNRLGHNVTVFERDKKAGGILTYGIPDYKIEKWVVERRIEQIEAEGVKFVYNTNVGIDCSVEELEEKFDAIVLAGGSKLARDLPVYGRELNGIYYAMDYLIQQNVINEGKQIPEKEFINAKDKSVIIIGGGDTGADCLGTALRQGAKKVYQIELLTKPLLDRPQQNPWPNYPQVLKVNTAHEEANELLKENEMEVRQWEILTKEFIGDGKGNLKKIKAIKVEWKEDENGKKQLHELEGTEFELDIDLALLAIGFVHPEHEGLVKNLNLELDGRGNVKANTIDFKTNKEKVFAAGDIRKGQSLVVWAIAEGRGVAEAVDKYLMD